MAKRVEILLSGFGGQGVVRIGQIVSLASVYEGLYTTMLVSHGTETRGGYVRTQSVMSTEPVDSPVVENPDFFGALSKAAYDRFRPLVKNGVILYDPAYVEPSLAEDTKHIAVPARDTAMRELGRDIFANIIMLGFLIRLMEGTLGKENALKAMLERVPKFKEENTRAFEMGYALERPVDH